MKFRRLLVAVAVAAVLVIAVFVGTRFAARPSNVALKPSDTKVLAVGKKVYNAHCASCHGARLEGQPNWRERGPTGLLPAPPHDETGHTWHHPDDLLFRITKYGVAKAAGLKDYASAMPVYEDVLSDEEIIAALSWIKAQWPERIRDRHDQMKLQQLPNQER